MKKIRKYLAIGLFMVIFFQPTVAVSDNLDKSFSPRIIGGSNASIRDAPWQVALVISDASSDFDGQFCGGSILAPTWVITAAHCLDIEGLSESNLTVVAGTSSLSSESLTGIEVDEFILHPDWASDEVSHEYANDLALISLKTPISMVRNVTAAIALPTARPKSNSSALISGWGVTNNGFSAHKLQKAQVRIVSDSVCSQIYNSAVYEFVDDHKPAIMVCASGNNFSSDTCYGDSGGPLAIRVSNRWELHGITSFGVECAVSPFPGVYTEVYDYKEWINSEIYEMPVVEAMEPEMTVAGSTVTLNGYGFTGTTSVVIDSISTKFTVWSDSDLSFSVPRNANTGEVIVSNPGHSVSAGILTVVAPPKISSVSPQRAKVGQRLIISGSNFYSDETVVTISGTGGSRLPLTDLLVSSSQIQGIIPEGSRSGSLIVSTPFGSSTTKFRLGK